MPTCTVERHMAGYENTVQTRRKVCEQVEYYLSDENLQKDRFFRELIASDAAGWIDLTPIMQCNKIKETKITKDELAEAIQTSEVLQFNNGWVRRKISFQAGNGNTKGEAKGGGKGKGKRGNANLPSVERASPIYDPSGPCGYFMAGYCQRGDSCSLQHSVPYAMAIRHEWLNPGNRDAKRDLQTLSMRLLGETATKELFPRVFSHKLQCKEMPTMPTDDISMLGFSWSTDEAPAPDKVSRWNRHPQKMTADIPARKLQGQQAQQAPKIRYFLVFDLEGKYEIIEFPVLLFDAVSGCEIGRFQKFVRPKDLFEGCPISDTPAVPFPAALEEFDSWLQQMVGKGLQKMGKDNSGTPEMVFVTCGDWDCKHVRTQCQIWKTPVPTAFSRWINIKRSYSDSYGGDFRGMKSMQLGQTKILFNRVQSIPVGLARLCIYVRSSRFTVCLVNRCDANGTQSGTCMGVCLYVCALRTCILSIYIQVQLIVCKRALSHYPSHRQLVSTFYNDY